MVVQPARVLIRHSTLHSLPGLRYHLLVGEVFSDGLEFSVSEYLRLLRADIDDPRMINDLPYREPFRRFRFKEPPEQVLEVPGEFLGPDLLFLERELALDYHGVQVLHVVRLEGHRPEEHRVQAHAQTPYVRRETLVARTARLLTTD